jgi:hypothetical protein
VPPTAPASISVTATRNALATKQWPCPAGRSIANIGRLYAHDAEQVE